MSESKSAEEILFGDVRDAYYREHERLMSDWRNLELKAQATSATAGVFLAGAFAFVRNMTESASGFDKGLFVVAILLLSASIGFSIGVLFVRRIASPPKAEDLHDHAVLLYNRVPTELAGRFADFIFDQLDAWRVAVASVSHANQRKANLLYSAQVSLVDAAVVAAVMAVMKVAGGLT